MTGYRWDETWHRLLDWTSGQGRAERLAAQVLIAEGFEEVEPSHPLGGLDGGKDIRCRRDGRAVVAAVYFPRGQMSFSAVRTKFESDLAAARDGNDCEEFVFVTNQELRLAERSALSNKWTERVTLIHLDRLTAILDQPAMAEVRRQFLDIEPTADGLGGNGGGATVFGDRATAMAGKAGRGGTSGRGGHGGAATAIGDDVVAIGGDGGDAGTPDGRGGRGASGPTERYGVDTSLWGYGRGGAGADDPEYRRRMQLLARVRQDYLVRFPQDQPYVAAGVDAIPVDWVNQRLDELGERWHVSWGQDGYELPALDR